MPRLPALALASLLALVPLGARAQAARSAGSSGWLYNGATLGGGRSAFLGEFGWPGLSLSLLTGESEHLDLGGYFSFNYGFEGIADFGARPGFQLGGIARLGILRGPRVNFGLRLSPGIFTYFFTSRSHQPFGATVFGLRLPVEFIFGVLASPQLSINFAFAMPFTFTFTPEFVFILPLMPGFGFEYRVDPAVSFGLDFRFGPAIEEYPTFSRTDFAFRAMFGIGYRF